jgi:hypothetical protein
MNIFFRESLLFEKATPSGNESSSMDEMVFYSHTRRSQEKLHKIIFTDLLYGFVSETAEPLIAHQQQLPPTWCRTSFIVGASRGGLVRSDDLNEQDGQALHLYDALGLCHRVEKRDARHSIRME